MTSRVEEKVAKKPPLIVSRRILGWYTRLYGYKTNLDDTVKGNDIE